MIRSKILITSVLCLVVLLASLSIGTVSAAAATERPSYDAYASKYAASKRPVLKLGTTQLHATKAVQSRLYGFKYMELKDITGVYNRKTKQAVMAFQGWEGLKITGDVDAKTWAALDKAQTPFLYPSQIPGYGNYPELKVTKKQSGKKYVVVDIKKQVMLIMTTKGGRHFPERILHTSTGKTSTPTHRGNWRIYYKTETSSLGLKWLAAYDGNYAFHESDEVPHYPASHGCMRVTSENSKYVYDQLKIGTPIFIY